MFGRKNYTREGLDRGRAAVREQLAAYASLVTVIGSDMEGKFL